MNRPSLVSGSVYVILALALCGPLFASDFRTKFTREAISEPPVLICTRVKEAPKIDGDVDGDAVWATCGHTKGAWVQLGAKTASRQQTVVYACFDEKKLYLGFVCEETELTSVRMNGQLVAPNGELGSDDFVEAVLEVGGTQGNGEVYSFRGNKAAKLLGWGFARAELGGEWECKCKFGSNRWMVEMAIPFAILKRSSEGAGLPAPLRGDVLGIKLARYGALQANPANRMISTFNIEIPVKFLYACGGNGLLYFEDSNALSNGNFAHENSPWMLNEKPLPPDTGAPLTLNAGDTLAQMLMLRPGAPYVLSLDYDGAAPQVFLDERKIDLNGGSAEIVAGAEQKPTRLKLKAAGAVKLKSAALNQQPGEEPTGIWCLTNNYHRPEQNIRALAKDAPEGSYRYVTLDYNNNITGEDHPNPKIRRSWSHDPNQVVPDLGGMSGWIPFSKGSLTGKPDVVFWQVDNPPGCGWRQKNIVMDIDLGRNYFVRGLDILWPAPYMVNVEVWVKADGDAEWTLIHTGDGPFVDPAKRRAYLRGYEHLRGLDSVARYVRWRSSESNKMLPQMEGLQEFWVWGEPQGQHPASEKKCFVPWVAGETAARPGKTATMPDEVQIVPRPRKLEREAGQFVINAATRIAAPRDTGARRTAEQIRRDISELWNLDLQIVDAQSLASGKLNNTIYLGLPSESEQALNVAKTVAADVPDKPQAYALHSTPDYVAVLGRDGDGLYWGVQSLMMPLRWMQGKSDAESGPAIPAMRISDWPGTLSRGLWNGKASFVLNMPATEIERCKRLFQVLSRYKINTYYMPPLPDPHKWPPGAYTNFCREVREEYHIELCPDLLTCEAFGHWWRDLAEKGQDFSVVEADPDEAGQDIGGQVNICPLDPKTYELAFAAIDERLALHGNPSKAHLLAQVYHIMNNGARWNVCRACQRSGLSSEQLYALFLKRISDHLAEKNVEGILASDWVKFAEPNVERMFQVDPHLLPSNLIVSLPDVSAPDKKQENLHKYIADNFDPARTAGGSQQWPSQVRVAMADTSSETHVLECLMEPEGAYQPTAGSAEAMWYAPDTLPEKPLDYTDLKTWLNSFWFRRDFPGWRRGERPEFLPLDLRPFATASGHATGKETLTPGAMPALDLRYLPGGRQVLAGIGFDVIDPASNGGKSIILAGRPPHATVASVAAQIAEKLPPIPVNSKLASIAFLRTQWHCSTEGQIDGTASQWLRPTCRVIYDDDQWLVVDAFKGYFVTLFPSWYRLGWNCNSPSGQVVSLEVVEWVNPYPAKTIKSLEIVTPDFEDQFGKRINPRVEAIVAITGVKPRNQDFVHWDNNKVAPPLLPPSKPRPAGLAELKLSDSPPLNSPESQRKLKLQEGAATYRVQYHENSRMYAYGNFEGVVCTKEFAPFGVTQVFSEPVALARVEVLGPFHNAHSGGIAHRGHKVDVTLEISEDGNAWQRVGEVRGISSEADFQPIDFTPRKIKAIRLTGDPFPYRRYYHQPITSLARMMFDPLYPCMCPQFYWRLYAPKQ